MTPSIPPDLFALPEVQSWLEDMRQTPDAQPDRLRPPFRGEIYEDDTDNECFGAFLRCHFHRPVLRALNRPTTRFVGIRHANQIGGTTIGELGLKHRIKYDPGNMVMYDISDDASGNHMRSRAFPIFRSVPEIDKILADIQADDRWKVTTQDIIFPGMVFWARSINPTTTERITVRYGMISDARLTEKSGLIPRAFIRSRQHERDCLWIVESYGGVAGSTAEDGCDFHKFMCSTDDAKLYVACPACGEAVRFTFLHERGSDYVPTPPASIPSLDRQAWIDHHIPIYRSKERHFAGFKIVLPGNRTPGEDDSFSDRDVMLYTKYECPHCGTAWDDDGEFGPTRRALDVSAGTDTAYRPTRPSAIPGRHGFTIPVWINPRISWGSVMLKFRSAMKAKASGNLTELEEFRTKWEGEDWNQSAEIQGGARSFSVGTYETDPSKLMPNHHCRQITVDCHGKEDNEEVLGSFWFEGKEFDKAGHSRQFARGWVDSFELIHAQQVYWGVHADRVFFDCAWMPSQVEEAAVRFHEMVAGKKGTPFENVKLPRTWMCARGTKGRERLTVPGGKGVAYLVNKLPGLRVYTGKDGKVTRMWLYRIDWSNLYFEKQLVSILSGGVSVKWDILTRDEVVIVGLDGKPNADLIAKSLDRERDAGTYENQMNSRYYNDKTGKYEDYDKRSWSGYRFGGTIPGRPTEYRDCGLMHLAGIAQDGLLGHIALPTPSREG